MGYGAEERAMQRTGADEARALVVEADPAAAAVIRHYLELEGFSVVRAAHVVQALALARVNRPRVLVIGAGAPASQNGPLLRVLRADPALRTLPVVLVDITRADALDTDDPFTPVHPRQLASRINVLPADRPVLEAALVG
jgi:CheY-like chemotaxis protein